MQILQDWLEETVFNIKAANGQADPPLGIMSGLRELQLRLNPLFLANVDSKTRLVAYFLNSYVDNIFMDLCGDTPDDGDGILRGVREVFFEKITKHIEGLLDSLKTESNPIPILEDLVDSYAEAVNALNYSDKK